jgi:hypothetical protein
MLVEPGFFRTELLTPESTRYAESTIEDYTERSEQTVTAWKGMDGQQGGDPAKLADALIRLAELDEPPLRFAAGANNAAVEMLRTTPEWHRPAPRRRHQPDLSTLICRHVALSGVSKTAPVPGLVPLRCMG